MSNYKVIQDIEAEDKLLGPLTLRQFIYTAIVITIGFVGYRLVISPAWFLAIPLIPPFIFFGLLAAPFGREQSSEVWLLGKVRYMVFSKKRIWDQEGIEHLVTITVPKPIDHHYSDGLSKTEVKSRLKTLAATMDTRGWVVKNASTTEFTSHGFNTDSSDRLLKIQRLPQEDVTGVKPASDVLDSSGSNPAFAEMSSMVAESEQSHRKAILSRMQELSSQQKINDNRPAPKVSKKPAKPMPPSVSLPENIVNTSPATAISGTVDLPNNQPKQQMTQPQDTDIINDVNKRKQSSVEKTQTKSEDSVGDDKSEVVVSLH